MAMGYEKLLEKWSNNKFDPIYVFHGGEDFIIEKLSTELVSKAIGPDEKDFNLDVLYANETDGASIINIVTSYPMMAERRVVLLKNFHLIQSESLRMLNTYAQNPSSFTILVIIAEKLDKRTTEIKSLIKNSVEYEAKPLYDNKIPDWIRGHLAPKNITISNEALRFLQASTGNSLRNLCTEIDKICLNLAKSNHIEIDDVEKVVGISKQFNVFELCDAVGQKNLLKSLKILNQMIQLGESPIGIMAMLTRHFFILARLRELQAARTQKDELAKILKIHPFFLQNYARQAVNFKREQFKQSFKYLLEADKNLKTSYQKPRMILEILLFKLNRTSR